MRPATASGLAAVNGAHLFYQVYGDRRPESDPLVLVPAGIADSRMWDDQIEAFAPHFQVIRYDPRGWGRSDAPTGPVAFHEDLCELLRALQVESAHVLGVSMGGTTAIDFALTHPEMARSLLLVGSWLSGFPTEASPQEAEVWQAFEAALNAHDYDRANQLEVDLKLAGIYRKANQVDPAVRERLLVIHRAAFDRLDERERMRPWLKPEPPAVERLGEISAPTLVVYGELDVPAVPLIAARLGREIPGAQVRMMQGTAHAPTMEHPAAFNRLALEFWSGLSSSVERVASPRATESDAH